MLSKYPGKSAKLDDISDEVFRFFETRGFKVSIEKKPSRVLVSVGSPEGLAQSRIADVTLTGGVDGSLTVTFERHEGSLGINSLLPWFGGGFLTLKKLKLSEILERLERDFWDMVDRSVVSR